MGSVLTTIPRPSREEFEQYNVVTRWLIATRASVLALTLTSAVIAGMLAFRDHLLDFPVFVLVTVGLMLAHATNNLLNDLVDWSMGIDQNSYFRSRYGSHPCTLMSRGTMIGYVVATGLAALAVGLSLTWLRGPEVFYLMCVGAFFLLFYTWPLKYIACGEISVFLVWGPLMVAGSYYTITRQWSDTALWASVPHAFSATAVIFGKHIDKLAEDTQKRVFTLPVVLGEKRARFLAVCVVAAQYASIFLLVFTGRLCVCVLVACVALPRAVPLCAALRNPAPHERPADYPSEVWPLWFVAGAFRHSRVFGALYMLGLLCDAFWSHGI